jgi:hypothetical protein
MCSVNVCEVKFVLELPNMIYSIALKFISAEFVTLQNYLFYLALAFLGFMAFHFHSNLFSDSLHTL